jgi:hypothetical protein
MSDGRINEYNAKCGVLQNALVAAERLVNFVIAAGKTLQQGWQQVIVSGLPESNSIGPSEGKMLSIDGLQWPDGPKLAKALADYRKARKEAHRLYDELRASGVQVLPPEQNINEGKGSWR